MILERPARGDTTPQQRAALVAFRLAAGERFSTAELADWLSMSYQGARRLMSNLSGPGLPVVQGDDGRWGYIY